VDQFNSHSIWLGRSSYVVWLVNMVYNCRCNRFIYCIDLFIYVTVVIQPYTNTIYMYNYVYKYIPTVYLSIVSMPQGCKSLAYNGETMRWHMMGSQKVYLEYVQHIYMYIYICVMSIYICICHIYIFIMYILPILGPPQFCLLDIMSPHGTSETNIHQFIQSLAWFKKQLTYL
jgi:hypothetical protein